MTRYQNHAGFQVSLNKLQLVEVNYVNKQFVLENVDEEFYSDLFSFKDKENKLITILQNAFNDLTFRKPLTSSLSSFTLPSSAFKFFDLPYDEALTKKDFDEHVKWELSVLLPEYKANDLAVQTIRIENSNVGREKNMLITVLPKHIITTIDKFCLRNNLKLRYIDNEHFSSNNLLLIQNKLVEGDIVLSLLVRENYFSVILLENTHPVYFELSHYKGLGGLVSCFNLVLKKIRKAISSETNIIKSYLFGDYYSEAVVQKINDETGLGFQTFNPFDSIPVNETLSTRKELVKQAEHYSSAAGIAFRLV